MHSVGSAAGNADNFHVPAAPSARKVAVPRLPVAPVTTTLMSVARPLASHLLEGAGATTVDERSHHGIDRTLHDGSSDDLLERVLTLEGRGGSSRSPCAAFFHTQRKTALARSPATIELTNPTGR